MVRAAVGWGKIDRCVANGLDSQTRRFVARDSTVSLAIERNDHRVASTGVARRAGFPRVMVPGTTQRPVVENSFSPRAGDGKGVMIARLPAILPAALWMLLSVLATGAHADNGIADRIEFSERLSTETRLYPGTAAYPRQRSHASGLAVEATAYIEEDEGGSVTVTPFFRYDAGDPDSTYADFREVFLLLYGDVGEDEWELRLGVDRVFWGVVESRSLVDIVNQTDLVEHPDEKTKLGQPMVHLTWSGDWGALELFGLTWHRKRTFPGRHGRLRPGFVVDPKLTTYESAAEEWHLDLAGRYSGSLGPLDVGLSVFDGTSREPTLLPKPVGSELVLAPHYEQIRQFGLDTQLTTGPWLLKLEAIHRAGAQNRRLDRHLKYEEEDYAAFIAGGEYTINALWESDADLSLIVEWARDGRGRWATNAFENDILLAARLGLNDEPSTELSVSALNSLDYSSRVLGAEFKRRFSDSWSLHVEASAYVGIDKEDVIYAVRRDSYIGVNLDYGF